MLGIGSDAQTNIKAVITADDRASSVLKGFGDNVHSFGGVVEKGLKTAAVGLAAAGAAAVAFGALSVKAFSESEDMIAQTNAVLKSTGGIAGVTADQVTKLATALQKTTKFSDEDVRSAENLLLTFTSIGKDIFPQATKTVLDMATALGEDTKSASIQLGKALQDPILGVTALRRVGVNFSEDQKNVIANLVETGQKAKAQQLILKELQTEFGGSAEAAGKTFAGSLAILKNNLNDVQEQLGQVIVTRLTPFISKALEAVASVDWAAVIDRTINALISFKNTVTSAYQSVAEYLAPGLQRFWEVATQVWNFLVGMFAPSFNALADTIQTRLLPQLMTLWNAIEPGFTTALQVAAVVIGGVIVGAIWVFINALNVVFSVIGGGIRVISSLISWLGNIGGVAINAAKTMGDAFKAEFNAIAHAWNATVGKLSFHAPSWVPGFGGKGFDVPDIPYLAEGGIVTKPTIAMIGEAGAEAVVPLNKAGGFGGTTNIVVNVGLYAGSEQEKRKVAMELMKSLQDLASAKGTTVADILGVA
jgi:hypothetical protein